ncbi:MAG: PRC-barrel domain-containing protein [Chloroflexi bacterium]|nr:PRC-barrel domain-containing protein [Chloroflexota bacterium]
MMKRFRCLAILLSLALALMACQLIQQVGKQPAEPASAATASLEKDIPTDKVPQTEQADPAKKQTPEKDNPDATARAKPPQSQAAEIRPKEMRTKLTHLSNLIGYQVLDENGDKLGVASDYIVNTCETYIIYILMEPVASLNIAAGNRVVIPFEVVTINSGVLDAQNKTIQLRLITEQFSGAPTLPAGKQLTPTDWEGATRAFWMKAVRIGKLATSCNVSSGPTYKVAYATQLLGVELYDGNKNLLGSVQEAILEPESGQIGFYFVKPAKGDGLVMVSLGVTNIPKEALLPGGALTLVLLAQPAVFWDAPRITSVDQADDFALQAKMRQYWGR